MVDSNFFVSKAKELKDSLINIRRHIHQFPELSFEEKETTEFILNHLKKIYLENNSFPLDTGIVGEIEGATRHNKHIALRADIDALPIVEKNEVPYKSKHQGVMHACGHDVHTTCLIGALTILAEIKQDLKGKITYIFQPGEEKNPGGASLLINSGIFDNKSIDKIVALHVDNNISVGKMGYLHGKCMASADEIHITITSEGGHAASPHLQGDTIYATSQLIIQLQSIISRRNDPFNPSVLSICSVNGGNTTNVVPNEVNILGTFRAMNEQWREQAHEYIKETCDAVSKTLSVNIDLVIDKGYPMVYNDIEFTDVVKDNLTELWGNDNVVQNKIRMGAEDFGYFSQKYKGTFLRLGVKPKHAESIPGVHHPQFNIDEDCLMYGAASLAWIAYKHNCL